MGRLFFFFSKRSSPSFFNHYFAVRCVVSDYQEKKKRCIMETRVVMRDRKLLCRLEAWPLLQGIMKKDLMEDLANARLKTEDRGTIDQENEMLLIEVEEDLFQGHHVLLLEGQQEEETLFKPLGDTRDLLGKWEGGLEEDSLIISIIIIVVIIFLNVVLLPLLVIDRHIAIDLLLESRFLLLSKSEFCKRSTSGSMYNIHEDERIPTGVCQRCPKKY